MFSNSGGKRTPMGEHVGALKDISAIELGHRGPWRLESTGPGRKKLITPLSVTHYRPPVIMARDTSR
jgi:hypothetical protein